LAANDCRITVESRSSSVGLLGRSELYHIGKLCCYQHAECYANCVNSKEECDKGFESCAVAECFAHLGRASGNEIDECHRDYALTNSWVRDVLLVTEPFLDQNFTIIREVAKCGINPKQLVLPGGVPG